MNIFLVRLLNTNTSCSIFNKNAFQEDAYRPLVDCMLESAYRGGGGGGVSAWSRGGLPGLGGVCLVWGVCLVQGVVVSAWSRGGSGIPACTEANTLLPCGQTHACKNITLATTSLRPVIIPGFYQQQYHLDSNVVVCKNFSQGTWLRQGLWMSLVGRSVWFVNTVMEINAETSLLSFNLFSLSQLRKLAHGEWMEVFL